MPLSVVITAAGSSRRMGGVNKLLVDLGGRPVLVRTLETFAGLDFVDRIVVTANAACVETYRALVSEFKIPKVCCVIEGGKERQDSIFKALQVLEKENCSFVAVHDGARPLASAAMSTDLYLGLLRGRMIDETEVRPSKASEWEELEKEALAGLESGCREVLGTIPGVPVKDTIKRVDSIGLAEETLVRSELRAVQTPQIFFFVPLIEAYRWAYSENYLATDDAGLIERYAGRVLVMPGEYSNLKITTVDDISLAERLLEEM